LRSLPRLTNLHIVNQVVAEAPEKRFEIVVMAASFGGVQALQRVLSGLPVDFPVPIVVVQQNVRAAERPQKGLGA